MARIRFLGHAAFHIEGEGLNGLVDPWLSGNGMSPFSPEDFPKANFIFVTHGHGDHLGDTSSIAGKTGATVVGKRSRIFSFDLVLMSQDFRNWLHDFFTMVSFVFLCNRFRFLIDLINKDPCHYDNREKKRSHGNTLR